ncbi:MAG: CsgG/HfaB family protein [Myxococcota bacterium]
MRPWFLLFAVLVALPAWGARSVAVLPLDAAAKSDQHEGLGRALAGMLISDLSRVDDLELVERARLDALIKEIELGDTGFLDPKTAVKLGNGVGAEWVIVGSWSVVGGTFLMDTRAVDVGSGKIVAAVDASGKVDDFVTVEKTLVEDLLEALQVALSATARRKIIADAATEDFEALTTYAAGLQAEFDGRYADAKKRFEEAAQRDPAFELPLQRLADVRTALESLEAERKATRVDAATQLVLDALAKSPDEMKLTGRTTDPKVLGQIAVRWALLEKEGRKCQVVEEMKHYLERHKGKLTEMPGPSAHNHRHWAAYDLGLYEKRPEIWDHGAVSTPRSEYGFEAWIERAPAVSRAANLVVGITDGIDRAPELGRSLVNLSVACAGTDPGARLAALEEVLAMSRRLGFADDTMYDNSQRPMWTEVEVMVLQAMAAKEGMSARVQQRSQILMDMDIGHDDTYALRNDVSKVAQIAERAAVQNVVLDGLTEGEVRKIAKAALAGDASVLAVAAPACESLIKSNKHAFETLTGDTRRASDPWVFIEAGLGATSLRLAGCVVGQKAELATLAEALAWADTMPKRAVTPAPEGCTQALADLGKQTESYRTAYAGTEDVYRPIVVGLGMRLVRRGCATVR